MFALSQEGVKQLIALFKASLTADNSQHRSIQQQLSGFNSVPDFNAYLAYILNQSQEDGAIRQLAGLTLKNNIKDNWHELLPEDSLLERTLDEKVAVVNGDEICSFVPAGP